MKKILFYLLLLFALTACGGEPSSQVRPTATPNPGEIALQMMQQQMAANATAQVLGLNFTATAQIVGATSTAEQLIVEGRWTEQARMDAQATAEQNREDGQATQARIDLDARATQQRRDDDAATEQARQDALSATQQAFVAMQSTASYNATSTFTVMTLTAIPPHATMTQLAVDNQIIVNNQNVEKAALDLQKARETNRNWIIYLLLGLVMFGGGLLWVIRKSRWNPIMDDNGELAGFGFDEKFVRPHVLPGAVLDLKALPPPLLKDEATIKEILVNDQRIRALAAMPVSPTSSGAAAYNNLFNQADVKKPLPVIEVVSSDQVSKQILEEIEGQVVEEG